MPQVEGEPRELDQGIGERFFVDRAPPACALQQGIRPQRADHRQRLLATDRGEAEGRIVEILDEDAAERDHDDRPERAVALRAERNLDAARRRHALHEQAAYRRAGERVAQAALQLRAGRPHLGRSAQAEAHEAVVRLVGDRRRARLQRDGITERVSRGHCLVRRGDEAFSGSRYAVDGKQGLTVVLVEWPWPGCFNHAARFRGRRGLSTGARDRRHRRGCLAKPHSRRERFQATRRFGEHGQAGGLHLLRSLRRTRDPADQDRLGGVPSKADDVVRNVIDCARRPKGWQERAESFLHRLGHCRHVESEVGAGIRHDDAEPTRVRQEAEPAARWSREAREEIDVVEQLLDVLGFRRADLLEERGRNPILGSDRARV